MGDGAIAVVISAAAGRRQGDRGQPGALAGDDAQGPGRQGRPAEEIERGRGIDGARAMREWPRRRPPVLRTARDGIKKVRYLMDISPCNGYRKNRAVQSAYEHPNTRAIRPDRNACGRSDRRDVVPGGGSRSHPTAPPPLFKRAGRIPRQARRPPLRDQGASFDDLHDDPFYPNRGPGSYEAYRKEIESYKGTPFPFSPYPDASYEENYLYELFYERYMDETEPREPLAGNPAAGRDDIEPDFELG